MNPKILKVLFSLQINKEFKVLFKTMNLKKELLIAHRGGKGEKTRKYIRKFRIRN